MSLRLLVGAVVALTLTAAAPAERTDTAGDQLLARVLRTSLPRVDSAARAASGRSPDAVQVEYDAARDFQEALERAVPVSRGCERLLATARQLARGYVLHAEGVDRLTPAISAGGLRIAAAAAAELRKLPRQCTSGRAVADSRVRELREPLDGEAFFGLVAATTPVGATVADVLTDGKPAGEVKVARGQVAVRIRPRGRPGVIDIELHFRAGAREVGRARTENAWLLPLSADEYVPAEDADIALAARLRAIAQRFNGYSAVYVHDLASGRTAGWNEDARFPAASTVKIAVLIAALQRFGPRPERSSVAYDLRTLANWSSNLAANRLLRELGGSEAGGSAIVQQMLTRLGATSSTYTGDYRVGTFLSRPKQHRDAPNPPPLVSQRVTTARDLGRMLALLHGAAVGDRDARDITGLSRHKARIGLALLLNSEPRGDNLGLLRAAYPKTVPMAQKQGWLADARHTAAVVYTRNGPQVVVVLTYRRGITREQAAMLGASVARVVR